MKVQEPDRIELERFYSALSTQIRLFGAEELGRRYVVIRLARMEANGHLDFSDLQRILARVRDLASWYGAWEVEGATATLNAEAALASKHLLSVGDWYLRAADCYHWGQYFTKLDASERFEGRSKRVELYRKALPYLSARVEPISIPYKNVQLPAYFHFPETANPLEPVPCVIMVDGGDSVKEEYHKWARQFARRGMAVVTFDGPGQGEMVGALPMEPERWEQPVSAVINYLERNAPTKLRELGLWGSSFGGFLACRAAAFEPRIAAAVSSGGFYDFRDFPFWPATAQANIMEDLGTESLAATRDYMRQRCSLAGVAEKINCPLLVIHGRRDELVTVDEAKQIADEAPNATFVCFDEGFHTCTNENAALTALMCDWMHDRLVQ